VAGGSFPESIKPVTLYFNAVGLLLLFGFIALYLLLQLRKHLSIRYEILAIVVYCLFIVTLSVKELGYTIFVHKSLFGNEALLFFPLQCLFISLHLYQQIIHERRAAQKALLDLKLQQEQDRLKLMIAVEEAEKKRIAQNLHDEVGGVFVALRYQALLLRRLFSGGIKEKDLDALVKLADEGIKKQYSIVEDLLFGASSSVSWEEAVHRHITILVNAHGLDIRLSGAAIAHRLSPLAQTQLFRILAELLNNTLKHAAATQVDITLTLAEEVQFFYADNGKGFDTKALSNGIGLINIRQRIEALHGTFELASNASGTTFQLQIPLRHA
jgi:signal transduction histidine kinase